MIIEKGEGQAKSVSKVTRPLSPFHAEGQLKKSNFIRE